MNDIPMMSALLKYNEEKNSLFCIPGHKGGKGFKRKVQKKNIQRLLLTSDLTEVEGLDNLHNPKGAIKEAEELLSQYYNSKRSYFMVNGSTSGNMAMIFSSLEEGDKILVERNCHKSIFNAIIMRKLNPIYLANQTDKEFNAPLGIDITNLKEIIEEHSDIKAIIVTYPNYYGVCCNLKYIVEICKESDIKVLVDAAHGAHFGAHPMLPENPLKIGVDMAVMSAHKTLPSLTQSAYLHVNDESLIERVDFYVSAFLSTSPSYMLMLSMDYARWYIKEEGNKSYEELFSRIESFKKELSNLNFLRVLDKKELINSNSTDIDESRIVINLKEGLSTCMVDEYLRNNKIQVEMIDASNLILIPSPFNSKEDFKRLYKALKNLDTRTVEGKQLKVIDVPIPKQLMMPFEAFKKPKQKVLLKDSIGKISAVNVCPYPPGVPIIVMGELIEGNTIEMIEYYVSNNVDVIGIKDGKIDIIKKHN